jgi:hypothetical protein
MNKTETSRAENRRGVGTELYSRRPERILKGQKWIRNWRFDEIDGNIIDL